MATLGSACVFDATGLRSPDDNANNSNNANTNANTNTNVNTNTNANTNTNTNQAVCGDGVIEGGEGCDDGDAVGSDGCSGLCQIEIGWVCSGEPSVCNETCGNGATDAGETCDDGNTVNWDGCSAACQLEPGWDCSGASCVPVCGDGLLVGDEACDDGNAGSGDGCDATCEVEPFTACSGAPSRCLCVIYVNHAGVPLPRTGASWDAALATVQEGIEAAPVGCEVWVAQGTYYIYVASLDDSVALQTGVGVHGGFAGHETARADRDPEAYPTVLHGANAALIERVVHVVTAASTTDATLTGVTITGGDARSGRNGGGLYLDNSAVHLSMLRVRANSADLNGGGLYAWQSAVHLTDSVISSNTADEGGGMDLHHQSSAVIDSCRFEGNTASVRGGGLRLFDDAAATVTNTVFANNTATDRFGGAVLNWLNTTATFTNCTFYGNSADDGAGAIRNYQADGCVVHNSILWGNTPNALDDFSTSVTITFSDIQDSGHAGSNNNISTDPLLTPEHALDPLSPCIDTASDGLAPVTDLLGNGRVDIPTLGTPGTLADMGAIEYHP